MIALVSSTEETMEGIAAIFYCRERGASGLKGSSNGGRFLVHL